MSGKNAESASTDPDPIYEAQLAQRLEYLLCKRRRISPLPPKEQRIVQGVINGVLRNWYPFRAPRLITGWISRNMIKVKFKYLKSGALQVEQEDVKGNVTVVVVQDFKELRSLVKNLRRKSGVWFLNTVLGATIRGLRCRDKEVKW